MNSKYYVLMNPEKENRARKIISLEGMDIFGGESQLAEANIYRRLLAESGELSKKENREEFVYLIYRGLGGLIKEFNSKVEADSYKQELNRIRREALAK